MMEAALPSLLLLPPPPHPPSRAALSAAYRPSFRSAIVKLRDQDEPKGAVLIVAMASPILSGTFRRQKSLSWSEAQDILAGVYSIISLVCAELNVATDVDGGRGSVDARVIFIDHDISKAPTLDFKPVIEPNNTVVVDLPTFVTAYHPWSYIFSVDNEAGHQLLATYLKMFEGMQSIKQNQLIALEAGLSMKVDPPGPAKPTAAHNVVCLGGTFDHLHPGHKLLLTAAALLLSVPVRPGSEPCQFIVGITGDELLKNKQYANYVQSWDERAMSVIDFLSSILELRKEGWHDDPKPSITRRDGEITASFRADTILVQCVQIQDAFGPTITTENMDALVFSAETRSGGAAVNERRKELGWRLLETYEVDVLDAEETFDEPVKTESFASKISSTAIRRRKAESQL